MKTKSKNLDTKIALAIIAAAADFQRHAGDTPAAHAAVAHATLIAAYFVTREIAGVRLDGPEAEREDAEASLRNTIDGFVEQADAALYDLGGHDELEAAAGRLEALLELSVIALLAPPLPPQPKPTKREPKKAEAGEAVLS